MSLRKHLVAGEQRVEEVRRDKPQVADRFPNQQTKPLRLPNTALPDHLSPLTDDRTARLRTEYRQVQERARVYSGGWRNWCWTSPGVTLVISPDRVAVDGQEYPGQSLKPLFAT